MIFCNDLDLLAWEPNIFRDAVFASQTLLSGVGDLSGTTFTLDAGSLTASHVAPNQVIVLLTGGVAGSYPIVSVNSATQLTLSVLYDGLFPEGASPQSSPVGTAVDLNFAVRTFSPQSRLISDLLLQAAGIVPGTESEDWEIFNTHTLRRPCVLGTLHLIYSALAAVAADPAELTVRANLYERLYRRALGSARVAIDTDGDGEPDVSRLLNVTELKRG